MMILWTGSSIVVSVALYVATRRPGRKSHRDRLLLARQAVAALSGKPTTLKIGTKFTIITNANLNTAASQAATYKTSC